MKYLGSECPICKEKLVRGQDIVVCPECGAPYHRHCYAANKRCVFEDRHKDGFEYAPPQREKLAAPVGAARPKPPAGQEKPPKGEPGEPDGPGEGPEEPKGILCPNCKTINDRANIFCERCGAPLHQEPNQGNRQNAYNTRGASLFSSDLGGEVDGVPKRDLHEFIGPSADIYIFRIIQQQVTGSKATFMASAFLLAPFYFAYRKMWGWAVLASALWLLLTIPAFLVMLAEGGGGETAAAMPAALEYVRLGADVVNLIIRFLFGFFALHLYRRRSVQKIKTLRKAHEPDGEYHTALQKHGGISYAGVALVLVVFFLVASLLSYFFGSTIINYVLSVF